MHRELVRMWLGRGNRAAALRQYTRMKDALARDLGVRPGAESLALWSELKSAAAPMPDAGPLVGRGGGNFGVITEFVFRLHRIGPQVTAGAIAWPASADREVLELYRETTATAPPELTIGLVLRHARQPPGCRWRHTAHPLS